MKKFIQWENRKKFIESYFIELVKKSMILIEDDGKLYEKCTST